MHLESAISDILAVRQFNRFYTKAFGFLQKRILGSAYALIEARVLYELANRPEAKATDISADLDLDPGYLSRILKKFEADGLIDRAQCPLDARSQTLQLTDRGEAAAAELADMSNADIAGKLAALGDRERKELVTAMQTIETTLAPEQAQKPTAVIRSHRPGDIGWVVSAHGRFYSEALGFNEKFEALVARVAADFISDYDREREHCWIAEVGGENVGSIFLVKDPETAGTARLRLLYVDEAARGLGLGKQLVDECLQFARRAGYKRVELYTNAVLATARHIYEQAGFYLLSEDEHTDFGDPQVGQFWALDL